MPAFDQQLDSLLARLEILHSDISILNNPAFKAGVGKRVNKSRSYIHLALIELQVAKEEINAPN